MAKCQAVTDRRRMKNSDGIECEFCELCMAEAVDVDRVRMVNLCAAHKAMAERAPIDVNVGHGQIAEFRI